MKLSIFIVSHKRIFTKLFHWWLIISIMSLSFVYYVPDLIGFLHDYDIYKFRGKF